MREFYFFLYTNLFIFHLERFCLDWSERRYHLAGALGNAILERLVELKWVQRLPKTRAIKITPAGKNGLKKIFFIDM